MTETIALVAAGLFVVGAVLAVWTSAIMTANSKPMQDLRTVSQVKRGLARKR